MTQYRILVEVKGEDGGCHLRDGRDGTPDLP